MDVHRSFAQVAILDGGKFTEEFRVELEHDSVMAFGQSLGTDDEVVLEATGNTAAIARLLTPFVARVVIANPLQVNRCARLIKALAASQSRLRMTASPHLDMRPDQSIPPD